ncbi:hypothetical protein Tco_0725376, partial [Tanacetum coccineum]
INEPIVPRFILDPYSQFKLQTNESGHLLISFTIQHEFITLSLEQFGRILRIPYTGQCAFTNEWDLSSLSIFQKPKGTYHTELPTPDDIHRFLRLERVESNLLIKGKNVDLSPNQVLTKEVNRDMKRWEELIRKKVFGLGARKTRKDRGIKKDRHSTSSSSAYHHRLSSHQFNDDEEIQKEGTSRASTPSPTTYHDSLSPIHPQMFKKPTTHEQNITVIFDRQTFLLNRQEQMHVEQRGAFKLFGKAIKGAFTRMKK